MRDLTYAGLDLVTILCIGLILACLNYILKKSEFAKQPRLKIMFGVLTIVLGWLVVTGVAAESGFLAVWTSVPPRVPFVPITALLAVIWIHRTAILKKMIRATPRHWPVAMQTFRIGVELAFWGLFASGGAPVQVTFEGRNFDVLVGLTAPVVAIAIAKFSLRPQVVILWNFLGLAILLNTIITTLTSTPGPLYLNWPEPFTAFAAWPFVWIPAFLAPLAIFLHVFSIRQNFAFTRSRAR